MKRHDEAPNRFAERIVAAVRAETQAQRRATAGGDGDGFGAELDAEDRELLAGIADALGPLPPPEALRARLMGSLSGRLSHYRSQIAKLLDVDEARAGELLDQIDDPSSFEAGPLPGVDLFHLDGGPAVQNAITGFIRIERGGVFPHHEHLGHEYVLVVQGAYRDEQSGEVFRPGDLSVMAPGTEHELEVLPGPALIYLAVVFEGVGIGGEAFRPGDPRM